MFEICDGLPGDGCHSASQDFISAHSSKAGLWFSVGGPELH